MKFLCARDFESLRVSLPSSTSPGDMFASRPSAMLLPFLLLLTTVNALHFYLDANEKRCFVEELPSDTVVEGTCSWHWPPDTELKMYHRTLQSIRVG